MRNSRFMMQNEVNFMFKNKFKPAHELRRKISIITVCALLVTVLCGSALLGGCEKTPALSDDVNSLISAVSGDKNGATGDNNSATGENSGDTANTESPAAENASGTKEPNNVTGDTNTVSTPESENKAPESVATDEKASNPQQQFKYYIQKLDEYGKTVRQTDYYEEKSTYTIEEDSKFDPDYIDQTSIYIILLHQYSQSKVTTWGEDTGWTLDDFKAMGATKINSRVSGTTGDSNEWIWLYFDNSTPEQVLEFGKELEKYNCVKAVGYNRKAKLS